MSKSDNQSGEKNSDERSAAESTHMSGYFVQLPPGSANRDIGFADVWRKIAPFRWVILSTVAIAMLLSVVVTIFMPPVYRSEVLLSPVATDNMPSTWSSLNARLGGLTSLAGINLDGANSKDEAIAILRSRSFAEDFISSENLLPVLFSGRWDEVNNRWNVDGPDDIPTISDAYRKFDRRIRTVVESRKTGLVTLGIEWTDREVAARWANSYVERLNQFLRTKDIAEAERSIEFLNLELKKNSVLELHQGIYRLIEHQIETVMLANVREEYAFKILDPAVTADENANVRPRRGLIIFGAFVMSLILVLFVVTIRIAVDESKKS